MNRNDFLKWINPNIDFILHFILHCILNVNFNFIFIFLIQVIQIGRNFPMYSGYQPKPVPMCLCQSPIFSNVTVLSESQCQSIDGMSIPPGCSYTPPIYVPDVFLMSIILFIGTFVLILLFREMKNTPFFASKVSNVHFLLTIIYKRGMKHACAVWVNNVGSTYPLQNISKATFHFSYTKF